MTRYVAFLRGINVGGHTVKMDRLRALFEELRLGNVATFIASGNVLFDTASKSIPALETRIERHLAPALGYHVATFVRPLAGLATVAASHPFEHHERDGHALHVGFLRDAITVETSAKLAALQTGYDEFHVEGSEVFWLCHGRMSDSALWGKALDRALGAPATFRSITTVKKLAALSS